MKLNCSRPEISEYVKIARDIGSTLDNDRDYRVERDWLTLYDELERYKKGLKEAVDDTNEQLNEIDENNSITNSFCEGIRYALDIMQRHFPELNFTKKEVETWIRVEKNIFPNLPLNDPDILISQDWLTMYDEIAEADEYVPKLQRQLELANENIAVLRSECLRYHKELKEMYDEMLNSGQCPECGGYDCFESMQKHFPELKGE